MIISHVSKSDNDFIEFTFRVETFDGGIEDYADIPSDHHEAFFDEFRVEFSLKEYPNHIITGRCTIELSKEDDGYWHLDSVQFYDKQITEATAAAEAQIISASDEA